MDLLGLIRILGRGLTVLVTICYFYQIVYLFVPLIIRRKKPDKPISNGRFAILIAARNEEQVLPYLLDSLKAQDYPEELIDIYVAADNCTDRTAELARAHGAVVFERSNTGLIGKGYVLNFLLSKIKETGKLEDYDSFLVFDADNLLRPDYISRMNEVRSQGYEAFCGYRNSKNYSDNWVSAGYALWYLHDSAHLNESRMLLGTTCAMSGTGFGFTRGLLEKLGGWNFFTLTEDIEFDTWCATNGVRIAFCPDAMLYDEQPVSFRQSWRQRTRWVQGGIQVSLKYGGKLLRGMLKGGRTSYASFETTTLSLWGYSVSAFATVLVFTATLLTEKWPGAVIGIAAALGGMYLSMLLVGALTTITQWDKIDGTSKQKIKYLFTFPLFMMTFIPIAATSLFRKFEWAPITHTVAVPVSSMLGGEQGAA